MECPVCNTLSRVHDTRRLKDGSIRRTRECPDCLTRFKTHESLVLSSIDKNIVKHIRKNA